MNTKKVNQKGFTIVELLIVIVVIGILAAIAFVAYGNITRQARDSERQSDTKAMMSKAEEELAQNGAYPADCAAFTALNGLNAESLNAPNGATGSNCATTTPSATSDVYQVTTSTTAGQPKLTITYWSEKNSATQSIESAERN